jgi:transcriptional regulator with PAS, ATPase and Fis domain
MKRKYLKIFKKVLTVLRGHGIIIKSSKQADKNQHIPTKNAVEKNFKKCLTKQVEHDKIIKSPKQGARSSLKTKQNAKFKKI